MSKELLEIYNLDSELIEVKNRKDFYIEIKKEFKKKNIISKKVKSIRLLLMNSSGSIYLQKRSKIKEENTGLYDKTVGGHITAGDNANMTVIRECAEELGFPAAVLSPGDFNKAIKVTNLDIIGIFQEVEYIEKFDSKRTLKNGSSIIQPYMTYIYIGYYNGPIKFVDGESSGIEAFSLKELEEDIKKYPEKFTEDIKFMIKKYRKYLKPIK